MAATAQAMAKLGGSKAASLTGEEQDQVKSQVRSKQILQQISVSGCYETPQGSGFAPGSSSSAQLPKGGRSGREGLGGVDGLVARVIFCGGCDNTEGSDGGQGGCHYNGEHHGGSRTPLAKMLFPLFAGEHHGICYDICLDYLKIFNILPNL